MTVQKIVEMIKRASKRGTGADRQWCSRFSQRKEF